MGLLNVRLGYWLESPKYVNRPQSSGCCKTIWNISQRLFSESWVSLAAREMLGFPNEKWRYVRLSDGGHFENLGLYELIRRKCSVIIVSDATADPNWTFSDLARAIERVRVDFGAEIDIDLDPVTPRKRTGRSMEPYAVGKVKYANDTSGRLIFLKTTLFRHLPEVVKGYARQHSKFPDEPTTDQFFDEEQFEAYRMLGYSAARRMFKAEQSKIEQKLDWRVQP